MDMYQKRKERKAKREDSNESGVVGTKINWVVRIYAKPL